MSVATNQSIRTIVLSEEEDRNMQMGSTDRLCSSSRKSPNHDLRHQLFSCVLCKKVPSFSRPKMLLCLHVVCAECLECHLPTEQPESTNTSVKNTELFAETIFSCPRCSFKTQLPKTGVSGLKEATFVLTTSEDEGANDEMSVQDKNANLWLAGSDKIVSLHEQLADNGPSKLSVGQSSSESRSASTRLRIKKLIGTAEQMKTDMESSLHQFETAKCNSDDSSSSLRDSIISRADRLCRLVLARRDHLLKEVDKHHNLAQCRYESSIDKLCGQIETLDHCRAVSDAVDRNSDIDSVDPILEDVSARINHVAGGFGSESMGRGRNIPEISALRLAVPDSGFEESHLEKLYGTLVGGNISDVELIMSFNTELHWPSALAVMRSRNSVLIGKTGAFSSSGRLIFYDRQGVCTDSATLESDRLPVDLVTVSDGCVLMSDVSGRISKYSSSGHLVAEWPDMFRGTSGRMAAASSFDVSEAVLVTSALDSKICWYNTSDGSRIKEFSLVWNETEVRLEPSAITTNSAGDILVTSAKSCMVYIFNCDGTLQQCFGQPCDFSNSSTLTAADVVAGGKPAMHLPSSLCCDPFDNVLVADFVANCVHLWSRSGRYLGRLLSERDGISCPNLVFIDQDGRLYVGQYGGEILVFQYLNFTKNI